MKATQKLLLLFAYIASATSVNAQVKVFPGSKTIIGSTSTPLSGAGLQVTGRSYFSTATGTVTATSAAYIRSTAAYTSASTPDYTWYKDSTTGFFHPAANTLGITSGGSEKMRIHSNGCVGIGTTSPQEFLQLGDRFTFHNGGTKYLGYNSYYDGGSGTNKRIVADYASNIAFGGGDISFNVAGTSSAGSSITFTDALHIKNDGNVGIGTTAPVSMLSVGAAGNTSARAFIHNSLTTSPVGVYGSIVTPTSGIGYGVFGGVTCATVKAIGVGGSSYNASPQSDGYAIGVWGQAGNAWRYLNYGVAGILLGSNDGTGIYGSDRTTHGLVGIVGNYAGYFSGKIKTTNDTPEKPTSGSWTGYSDERLKKDTASFKDGLNVLRMIRPVSYKFNGIGGLPTEKTYIGVIAQQVQQAAPYCIGNGKLLVKQSEASLFENAEPAAPDSSGEAMSAVTALTYNYDALIYVLINSVKQLDSTVNAMNTHQPTSERTQIQQELDALKELVNECCKKTNTDQTSAITNSISPETNKPEISNWLAQNKPNPFSKETVIEYNVIQEGKGSILIFDMNGKLLKTIPVKIPGKGSVTITANDLVAGMYYYTLVVNDVEVDTKKMILTQ